MAIQTKSRRRQLRYSVSRQHAACVEFEYPSPNGQQYRLPITNISVSGVSFSVDGAEIFSGLEEGTNLPGVVIRFGGCLIRGEMVLMHVTQEDGPIAGALFYPADDTDLIKLKSVIAGIEAVQSD